MQSSEPTAGARHVSMLPEGCRLQPLATIADQRGDFTELFRNAWFDTPPPLQWNMSRSQANVLRGVHVHARHWDYVTVLSGRMTIGLHDMRPQSAARFLSAKVELSDAEPSVLSIPPGIAHGFYFPVASLNLTAASRYYDPPDHMRCRWDCPELRLAWPCRAPQLSPADLAAGAYADLAEQLAAAIETARQAT
jgi:dTDP-4-dehydrorhamnose 3,5-epimerase